MIYHPRISLHWLVDNHLVDFDLGLSDRFLVLVNNVRVFLLWFLVVIPHVRVGSHVDSADAEEEPSNLSKSRLHIIINYNSVIKIKSILHCSEYLLLDHRELLHIGLLQQLLQVGNMLWYGCVPLHHLVEHVCLVSNPEWLRILLPILHKFSKFFEYVLGWVYFAGITVDEGVQLFEGGVDLLLEGGSPFDSVLFLFLVMLWLQVFRPVSYSLPVVVLGLTIFFSGSNVIEMVLALFRA